jgi:hypothetical protein
MLVAQVPSDRLRPVIQTLAGELLTQRDDPLRHLRGSTLRIRMRSPRARLQTVNALVAVSRQPSVDVLT